MTVITLAQLRARLGINDTSQDAMLALILPELDAKVKAITGRRWNDTVAADLTLGEAVVTLRPLERATGPVEPRNGRNVGNPWSLRPFAESLEVGQQLAGDGIPAGAYIANILPFLDFEGGILRPEQFARVEMSVAATETVSTQVEIGISLGYHGVIAKLAAWLIDTWSSDAPEFGIASRSMGPVSVTYGSSNAQLDGKHGVPRWAVMGLPSYGRSR